MQRLRAVEARRAGAPERPLVASALSGAQLVPGPVPFRPVQLPSPLFGFAVLVRRGQPAGKIAQSAADRGSRALDRILRGARRRGASPDHRLSPASAICPVDGRCLASAVAAAPAPATSAPAKSSRPSGLFSRVSTDFDLRRTLGTFTPPIFLGIFNLAIRSSAVSRASPY